MEMSSIWLIIALLALLIEIFTLGFAVSCFSVGALAAAAVAYFGLGVVAQLALFSLFSILSLIFIRPVVVRYLAVRGRGRLTNVEALVGRHARVSEPIGRSGGRVTIDGDSWRAVSAVADDVMGEGEMVEVVSVDSVVLTVKKL